MLQTTARQVYPQSPLLFSIIPELLTRRVRDEKETSYWDWIGKKQTVFIWKWYKGGSGGRGRLGVWDWHVHTVHTVWHVHTDIVHKIDNQQGPAI